MSIKNFRRALEIFSEYFDPDSPCLAAERGAIYVCGVENPISDVHCEELLELGWFQDDFEEDEDAPNKKYDAELDWACYV